MNKNKLLNNFYWNNTKFILNVEESTIPNAGNGIISYEYIPKDTLIGYYDGVIKYDNGACVGDYSFSLSKKYYIDARNFPRCYISMINDSHGSKFKNNCEFRIQKEDDNKKFKPHERKISLWAIKNIKIGDELFADYGIDYWKYR
jgi:hypothetical protein